MQYRIKVVLVHSQTLKKNQTKGHDLTTSDNLPTIKNSSQRLQKCTIYLLSLYFINYMQINGKLLVTHKPQGLRKWRKTIRVLHWTHYQFRKVSQSVLGFSFLLPLIQMSTSQNVIIYLTKYSHRNHLSIVPTY